MRDAFERAQKRAHERSLARQAVQRKRQLDKPAAPNRLNLAELLRLCCRLLNVTPHYGRDYKHLRGVLDRIHKLKHKVSTHSLHLFFTQAIATLTDPDTQRALRIEQLGIHTLAAYGEYLIRLHEDLLYAPDSLAQMLIESMPVPLLRIEQITDGYRFTYRDETVELTNEAVERIVRNTHLLARLVKHRRSHADPQRNRTQPADEKE